LRRNANKENKAAGGVQRPEGEGRWNVEEEEFNEEAAGSAAA